MQKELKKFSVLNMSVPFSRYRGTTSGWHQVKKLKDRSGGNTLQAYIFYLKPFGYKGAHVPVPPPLQVRALPPHPGQNKIMNSSEKPIINKAL